EAREMLNQRRSQVRQRRRIYGYEFIYRARVGRAECRPGFFGEAQLCFSHFVPGVEKRSHLLCAQFAKSPEIFSARKLADADQAQSRVLTREAIQQMDEIDLTEQVMLEPQYDLIAARCARELFVLRSQIASDADGIHLAAFGQ